MNRPILVAYATKRGSTREVAESIAAKLVEAGFAVEVRAAGQVKRIDPYGGVVLGGAIYVGRWHRDASRFLQRHARALAALPVAVFGMGPRTLAEADVADSRKQLDASLAEAPEVEPFAVAIFGGVVDPEKLRFPFSRMAASDARDWEAIDAWAAELGETFREGSRVSRDVVGVPADR